MTWSNAAAYFFGGLFLANFVPHFVAGVSGREFPSPFAKPPFRGLSSPTVNILWALFNAFTSYALFMVLGSFDPHEVSQFSVAAMGFGLASLGIARSSTKLQSAASPT